MKILITYDVETVTNEGKSRLRQVAKHCKDYGQRVQNSVFECTLNGAQYAALKDKLLHTLNKEMDSIRIYHLSDRHSNVIETLGKETSYNPEGLLLL